MSKIEDYKEQLQSLNNWDTFLLENSGLPGPRANLELIYAVAQIGDEELFLRYCNIPLETAPVNSRHVFLVCCGVVGLGKLINEGKKDYFQMLRAFASDGRWRVRESVAMALQIVGDFDLNLLLKEMGVWQGGNLLEKRAVVAGLCEPRLLENREVAEKVLNILDEITSSILVVEDRKSDEFVVIRKALGYGWSVVVVAYPEKGKKLMEKWIGSNDRDIKWVMKENLSKNRLIKMDEKWVLER